MSRDRTALPPEVARLWPAPAEVTLARRSSPGSLEYFVVPTVDRARVVVPRGVTGAGKMFVRYGGRLHERLVWDAWRHGHRLDLAGRLPATRMVVKPDPEGIEAFLHSVLGREVSIGLLLGPPRANRKPVIQIFDGSGQTIAFAKLGLTDLTRELLATEADALSRLGTLTTTTFEAPNVLHHGEWKGVSILVQQALSSAQRGQEPVEPPVEVMVEIATMAGIEPASLSAHPYLTSVEPPPGDDWQGVDVRAFHRLHRLAAADASPLPFGCWHGDFGPWNMGRGDARIEVWDWERFDAAVPVGIDAAHYRTQMSLIEQAEPAAAWPNLVRDVATVLAASGASTDDAARVAACYLLTIAARYRRDAGDDPTAAMQRRMTWLAATADVAAARVEVATS